jgi:hypothetical protein
MGTLVQQLVASPCASSLQEVLLQPYVSPAAAAALLSQLPRLQRLRVELLTEHGSFQFSSYPAALADLDVMCWSAHFNGAAALVAAPCAATLKRLSLWCCVTAPDVDVLLRGLPALEALELNGEVAPPAGGGEAVQPQQLRSFPATLQQLELHCWSDQWRAEFILDAAALAACCPQLWAVRLL